MSGASGEMYRTLSGTGSLLKRQIYMVGKGGIEMNGLDQVVVVLWFLPVILFIIIPLCLTCLWGVISFFGVLLRPATGQQEFSAPIRNS
jgi:hypothetical protein